MAENSLPLNPETTFTHISVHMIHILARLQAKRLVQDQLRAQGVRLSQVSPREVSERATAYLRDHVEVWKEAIARAHLIDEIEGRRKDRRRLRREQLARLRRPVNQSDNANAGTEMTQLFPTTSAIFRRPCLIEWARSG
jgi:hypothetical protein